MILDRKVPDEVNDPSDTVWLVKSHDVDEAIEQVGVAHDDG